MSQHIAFPDSGARASIIAAIDHAADRIGFTIPAKVTKAFTAHRTMLTRANILLEGNDTALAGVVVDALNADADPVDAGREHVLHAAIAQQATAIRNEIARREKALVFEHRDTIIEAAGKAIAAAHTDLVTAAQQLPNLTARSTPEQVLRSGAGTSVWQAAKTAQSKLDTYTALIRTLGYRLSADESLYLHVAPQLLDRDAQRSEWDAAIGGATLELCHPTEVRARAEKVTQLHVAREQAKQAEAQAAYAHLSSKPISDAWARKYATEAAS